MSLFCGGKKAKKKQKRDHSPSYGKETEENDDIHLLQVRVRDLENEKDQLSEENRRERKAKEAALQDNAKLKKQTQSKRPGNIDVVVKSQSKNLATEPANINRQEIDNSELKKHQDRIKELETEKRRLEEDLKLEMQAKKSIEQEQAANKGPSIDDAKRTGESELEMQLNNATKELKAEIALRKAMESEKSSLLEQLKAATNVEEKRKQAAEDIQKLQKELEQTKTLYKTEKKHLSEALSERDKYKKDRDSFEHRLSFTTKELDIARKESHIPQSPIRAQTDEWKSKIEAVEAELKKERETRLEREKEYTRLTGEKEVLVTEKEELQGKLKIEQARNTEAQTKLNNLEMNFKNNEKRLENTIEEYKRRLNESELIKDSLLTRLSTAHAAQCLDNNPNVTDLSDPNRPQKLAEQMAQLYDDQWTDASAELEKIGRTEQDAIKILIDMLIEVYKHCKDAAENQLSRIEEDIVLPPLDTDPSGTSDANGTDQLKSPTSSKQGMSKIPRSTSHKSRPALPNISTEKKTVIKGEKLPDIPVAIRRGIKEYRKKVTKQVWPVIEKEVLNKFRKNELFDENVLELCKDYITKCVELCWVMRVQDPPVALSWSIPDDYTFPEQHYRAYTKTGKHVEYVVWPAILQENGGPVLMKGVAQGVSP